MAGKEKPHGVSAPAAGGGAAPRDNDTATSEYSANGDLAQLVVSVVWFPTCTATRPRPRQTTWGALAQALTTHAERPEKDGPAWSPVVYRDGATRSNAGVTATTALVYDLDDGLDWEALRDRLDGYEYVAHSTHSSTPEAPKLRIVLPLTRRLTPAEHRDVRRRFERHVLGRESDPATHDPARIFYLPSCPPGALRIAEHHHGRAVDPDALPPLPAGERGRAATADAPSGLPIGRKAMEFIALGAPVGKQRAAACAVARNLHGAGVPRDDAVGYVWRGIEASRWRDNEPWTREQVKGLVADIYTSPAPTVPERDDEERSREKPPTQAEALLTLADQADLFHDPHGEPWADIRMAHRETWPVRSKAFRRWLASLYYAEKGAAPGSQALQDVLLALEGRAVFAGPERTVYTRLAGEGGVIWLDLCSPTWEAVRIDRDGWAVDPEPPIRFRRARGMLPLPLPQAGRCIDDLRRFVNVGEQGWRLYVAWLVAALRPTGPYPVLVLTGEQGTAKSTAARVARSLVDPASAPLRSEPREVRDLMIAGTNGWVVAFDNVSRLPDWLSDAVCRLATGGGFGTRELYTDNEEMIFDATRPVILNGIEEFVTRGDLLDRSLLLQLEPIPEEKRLPEAAFWREFEVVRPRLLGALLDAVSVALRDVDAVRLPRLPRMADFALWATAAEPALGWQPGEFATAYADSRISANSAALDGTAVGAALLQVLTANPTWSGTPAELLRALSGIVGEGVTRERWWPKDATRLGGILRRLAPHLRTNGVEVEFGRVGGGNSRRRFIGFRRMGDTSVPSVPASQDGPDSENGPVTPAHSPVDSGTLWDAAASQVEGSASPASHPDGGNRPVTPAHSATGDAGDAGDAGIHTHSTSYAEVF